MENSYRQSLGCVIPTLRGSFVADVILTEVGSRDMKSDDMEWKKLCLLRVEAKKAYHVQWFM